MLSAGVQAGCDRTASDFAAAKVSLDAALAKIDSAERGFSGNEGQDLQAYRQTALAAAIPDLKRVISEGSPPQQVAASRLHAQIDASAARNDTRQAVIDYAALANEMTSSVAYLLAVDRATARADDFDRDLESIVARYSDDRQAAIAALEQLSTEVQKLRQQLDGLIDRVDDFRDQADQAFAESQQLAEQAFVATGPERYELDEAAAQAELKADKASIEADKIAAQADATRAQLALVQAQAQLTTQDIADLEVQIKEVQQRGAVDRASRDEALAEREASVAALVSTLDELLERYQKQVRDPLDAAQERMNNVVGMLESATSRAGGQPELRRDVNADLLDAMIDRINILTEHALVAADFASKLNIFASDADRLIPDQAGNYRDTVADLVARQDVLRATAQEMVDQAKELAAEDADRLQIIEGYELRLLRSAVESGQ